MVYSNASRKHPPPTSISQFFIQILIEALPASLFCPTSLRQIRTVFINHRLHARLDAAE